MESKNVENILEVFQGKECFIDKLTIQYDDQDKLILQIHIRTIEFEAIITMYNVSNIRMNFNLSTLTIEGFEIIDNYEKGWSKDVRYCLNDFENGAIKLYFEKYTIVPFSPTL